MSDECKHIQDLIPDWTDNQLDSTNMDMINAHLKICKECAKYSKEQIHLIEGVKSFYQELDSTKSVKTFSKHIKADSKDSMKNWFNFELWIKPFSFALSGVFLLLISFWFLKSDNSKAILGSLQGITGKVEYKIANSDLYTSAQNGFELYQNTCVRTQRNGKVTIVFRKRGKLTLASNSFFKIKSGNCIGSQNYGTAIYDINKQKSTISVKTPQGLTCILGTTFRQDISSDSLSIVLKVGLIKFQGNNGKQILIKPSEQLTIKNNEFKVIKLAASNIHNLFKNLDAKIELQKGKLPTIDTIKDVKPTTKNLAPKSITEIINPKLTIVDEDDGVKTVSASSTNTENIDRSDDIEVENNEPIEVQPSIDNPDCAIDGI